MKISPSHALFERVHVITNTRQGRDWWLSSARMGVTGLWDVSLLCISFHAYIHLLQILRPSGKLRSLTHLAVVDGFEGNPTNLKGLRIGIDASIWFFHAAYGREGENPELRTLFFRCARLMSVPFLPLFIFDGPKRPKVKRGKRISGEKHWLVDSMKGMLEAFGYEWRMVCSVLIPQCRFLKFTLASEGSWRGRGRASPPE